MKKYIILFLSIGLCTSILTSCLEEYLDKAPQAGLTEEQVFSSYTNFMAFFNANYYGYKNDNRNISKAIPIWLNQSSWGIGREIMTDMSDNCLRQEGTVIKGGNMGGIIDYFTYSYNGGAAILRSMFYVIRTSNMALEKLDMLKDATQEDTDDIIAQAHFLRAFATFELFRWWGPMPYITKTIGIDDQWDIPRLSKHETLMKIAADMDTAYTYFEKAGRIRRDPMLPTQPGYLTHPDMFRPNGVAAKAVKARALVYAASPLNNEHGIKDWEDAAKACWEAIQVAEQYGYKLQTAADYKLNYIGTTYTNEMFWGHAAGNNRQNTISLGPPNECATQNVVDMFETKWGDPMNTQEDRDAATALGHYNEQDPFVNRDPRFYIDIVYNTCPLPGLGTAKIYWEKVGSEIKYGELFDKINYLSITNTGYYLRKIWRENNLKNSVTKPTSDPNVRYGELILNYAEACNEAYGPKTPAPGATMTAEEAINKIRGRWTASQLAPVQDRFTTSTEAFRPRIKNERNIELAWEGHYFNDIRRWKDAPAVMGGKVRGIDIEKVPVSAEYPTGYKYTRFELPPERQTVWKDAMYYWPFDRADNWKMKNFVPNEVW
jgi:hypothetical protein